jgi:hypothetical protein
MYNSSTVTVEIVKVTQSPLTALLHTEGEFVAMPVIVECIGQCDENPSGTANLQLENW